ncbi:MAG: hypothetical protein KF696_14530 [Planctomycetes bacterium]|nr:hypothetical protein [Planctomycetota bacterium]MCW8137165.1 hypothetical protein [Planctomycetota bacterium]
MIRCSGHSLRLTLGVLLLLAGSLSAHPLDDNAELIVRLRVADERSYELTLEFRYKGVIASYTEFRNGLDRNLDGRVTRNEMKARFVELADEIALGLQLSLDGNRLQLEPQLERFALHHADDPNGKPWDEIETATANIFYRFVYIARGDPAPGERVLAFSFISPQTVVHTPRDQLLAFSAANEPLPVVHDVESGVFPRMTARFKVAAPAVQPKPPAPELPLPDPLPAPRGFGELPGWLALGAGGGLSLLGLLLLARRMLRKQGSIAVSLTVVVAGLLSLLGALVRLGLIKLV